jgi:hypothetical protein
VQKTCVKKFGPLTMWTLKNFMHDDVGIKYDDIICRNPNLGLMTKAKAYKGASQEGSSGVTSRASGSVGKCEGMNLHTPKWTPTLGIRVSMDSRIFQEWF